MRRAAAAMAMLVAVVPSPLFNATPPELGQLVVLEGLGHGQQYPLQEASTSYRAMTAVDDFLAAHAPTA